MQLQVWIPSKSHHQEEGRMVILPAVDTFYPSLNTMSYRGQLVLNLNNNSILLNAFCRHHQCRGVWYLALTILCTTKN